MLKIFKKLIPSAALSALVMVQLSAPAFAATASDADAIVATDKAANYLADKQNNDGSLPGFGGETEWAVVAVVAKGEDPKELKNGGGDSAVDFIKNEPPATSATDLENRIIALSAAGEDTTNLHDELQTFHADNQIGNKQFLNDDMFGIIAIKAADDATLKSMAQDGLDYLIAHQNADDGFGFATADFFGNCCSASEIDMTSAAIVAMDAAEKLQLTNPDLASSKADAVDYLRIKQNPDGSFNAFGFASADSTSWALIAFNVIGESVRSEALLARNWLISNQNLDGSFGSGTFTTPHAIIALLGSSWLLDPAPLTGTVTPAPSSSDSKSSAEKKSGPAVKLVSTSGLNQGNVLSAATNDEEQAEEKKGSVSGNIGGAGTSAQTQAVKNGVNYSLFGLAALGLIAIGWFVLQSRQKQGV